MEERALGGWALGEQVLEEWAWVVWACRVLPVVWACQVLLEGWACRALPEGWACQVLPEDSVCPE